ncbi:hypothetical protein [Sandaracinobacteroides saxicola]|uniref:Uncharacterized protein n=1 Tax=Sandaracinobacteroides saxicola TaxID=2759707 RepID=A0A7G5IGD0_9SPHN|nr:hypothetical protein [Sandaracinobacteroides saxicola]QMW22422.1 hypothetical protein H3309_13890 [Sandaracinobacteroides saxicola]
MPKGKVREPKRVVLEKPFGGIAAGCILFVATPEIVADYVRAIPAGETRSVERMRHELARRHRADASCPVSTAIFVRQVAEGALKAMAEGAARDTVAPFWRLVAAGTPIAKRLPVDAAWLEAQLALDAATPAPA